MQKIAGLVCWCLTIQLLVATSLDELRQQDPTLWPGHLQPFGAKQTTVEVEQIDYWPEPIDFFKEYVEKNRPVVFKGLAKRSPAYKLFTDEFLKDFPGSKEFQVSAEPHKKEIRKTQPLYMSFHDFVSRYHNESLYMVNALPEELRKHVLMPAPLRCEETKELLSSQVTWFSSGGTKSVLHNDDVDNINCLYRGSKELLFIEYNKNKKHVPLDHPEGGYSSLDVDSVDYTKYPALRFVDQYHHVTMEEGDCLFIPYHWFHQVNSIASDGGQNLAVNVWFQHVFGHRPQQCDIAPINATLDKYKFAEDEPDNAEDGQNEMNEEDTEKFPLLSTIEYILEKKKSISLKLFVKMLFKNPRLNPMKMKVRPPIPEDIVKTLKEMFAVLDITKDGAIKSEDLDKIEKIDDEQQIKTSGEVLNQGFAVIEDFFEDLVEDHHQEQLRSQQGESSKEKDEL
ncbi:bifunctional peptidase and (3S)-lysyl hydroxylase Jmjd7-like [Clytia hemisphaerica]|uniref:JmjC domain-containing protein n=1 Tax=Clytia hemisphaerica TaxID=252671 RepID=A0A7M5WKE6_9CNID